VTTRLRPKRVGVESGLMDAVCERGNLMLAYQRVVENKGAAGVDGIGVAEFKDHLSNTGRRSGQAAGWDYMPSRCIEWTYQAARRGQNTRHPDAERIA